MVFQVSGPKARLPSSSKSKMPLIRTLMRSVFFEASLSRSIFWSSESFFLMMTTGSPGAAAARGEEKRPRINAANRVGTAPVTGVRNLGADIEILLLTFRDGPERSRAVSRRLLVSNYEYNRTESIQLI